MLKYWIMTFVLSGLCSAEGKWVEQKNPFTDSSMVRYVDVCFVDSLTGYALYAFAGWGVVKTIDEGKNWEIQTLPGRLADNMVINNSPLGAGITFIDSLTGWVVGYPNATYYTLNGGKTWLTVLVSFPRYLIDIVFVTPYKGWAVGGKGYPTRSGIIHTEDGGKTWMVQDSLTYPGCLYGVTFLDTLKGFAVGDAGLILRTLDGGAHWDSIPSGTTNNLYDIQFADSSHGIIVGNGSNLVSEDGGNTWKGVTNGAHGWDVAFPDSNHAWCVAFSDGVGGIYFSRDAGLTWDQQSCSSYIDFLYGVSFPDTAHGWAVGEYGHIIHYTLSTGIEEKKDGLIRASRLEVSPNPFRQTVAIGFQTGRQSVVTVKIFDVRGTLIKSLVDESKASGNYKIYWDGTDALKQRVPNGIYFCRLELNRWPLDQKKIILVH